VHAGFGSTWASKTVATTMINNSAAQNQPGRPRIHAIAQLRRRQPGDDGWKEQGEEEEEELVIRAVNRANFSRALTLRLRNGTLTSRATDERTNASFIVDDGGTATEVEQAAGAREAEGQASPFLRVGDAVRLWQLAPGCDDCSPESLTITNGPTSAERIAPKLSELTIVANDNLELTMPAYSVLIASVSLPAHSKRRGR
jgi:hypothetical protein